MDTEKVKEGMMRLWKETFGDSDEYVSLIFEKYFNPGLIAFHEENDEIKSALLGIPYDFESHNGETLTGLYLCGLATKKNIQNRGLMSRLLEKINGQAKEKGFDFTFLIPADEGMRRYYSDRGYHDSFYVKKDYYVRGHDFKSEDSLSIGEFRSKDTPELLEFLKTYGNKSYEKNNSYYLLHSVKDWETVLEETLISNEPVVVGRANDTICAVAFCKESEKTTEVKKLITQEPKHQDALLSGIMKREPGNNLIVVRDLEDIIERNSGEQLWSPFYAQSNGKDAEYEDIAVTEQPFNETLNSYSFGMIRIFDIKDILHKTGYSDLEALETYSEKELLQIVLRKPQGKKGDALEKILDLPEINFSMSLMLE